MARYGFSTSIEELSLDQLNAITESEYSLTMDDCTTLLKSSTKEKAELLESKLGGSETELQRWTEWAQNFIKESKDGPNYFKHEVRWPEDAEKGYKIHDSLVIPWLRPWSPGCPDIRDTTYFLPMFKRFDRQVPPMGLNPSLILPAISQKLGLDKTLLENVARRCVLLDRTLN